MSPMHINIVKALTDASASRLPLRHLRFVLAALFIFAQGFTVSHAVQYDNAPHEHNGVACEITLIAPDVDLIEPPLPVLGLPDPLFIDVVAPPFMAQFFVTHHCRAPPGRGPPNPS